MDKRLELLSRLSYYNEKKILLVVIDGLGGLPHPEFDYQTELQYANLPNLDEFVRERDSVTGLIYPVRRGIIPGSGVGHLGLFGYDPLFEGYKVGRGALEAADELGPDVTARGDIVARFNFCTIDDEKRIIDRRAGRISDCKELANLLNDKIKIEGATFKLISTKEYRGVLVIKNGTLSPNITDTDPQGVGSPILRSKATSMFMSGSAIESPAAKRTADIVNEITTQALEILKDQKQANGIIFRGFSTFPDLPSFNQVYSLNAAAIAVYPLYRGIAKLVGMTVLHGATDLKSEISILKENYKSYNFFFLHYKDPDTKGEDSDFLGKVKVLEDFDRLFPEIRKMHFDVLAITGDHSTPSVVGGHSHHSVPLAINGKFMKGFDRTESFDERECIKGSLGRVQGGELMTILLANAEKLHKFEGFV